MSQLLAGAKAQPCRLASCDFQDHQAVRLRIADGGTGDRRFVQGAGVAVDMTDHAGFVKKDQVERDQRVELLVESDLAGDAVAGELRPDSAAGA